MPPRFRSAGLLILEILLPLAWLAAWLAWLFDPFDLRAGGFRLRISWDARPLLAAFALLALWFFLRRRLARPAATRLLPRLTLSLAAPLLALLALEGLLALAGFEKGEAVFVIQGKEGARFRADGSMVFDDDLLWRFEPGARFHGQDINEHGFMGPALPLGKAPGTVRVAWMGDSCTAEGQPAYPELLRQRLAESPPDARTWESFQTAVHGYTVRQGLELFRKRTRAFAPDLVGVYFGWNDHWLSEQPDHLRVGLGRSPLRRDFANGLARKRLVAALARRQTAGERVLRVPPDRYREGLRQLVREIRDSGAEALLITAPRAPKLSRILVHNRNAPSVEAAEALHDQYAELTREVAKELNAPLADLAALAGSGEGLFHPDGIHLTPAGHAWAAVKLYEALKTFTADTLDQATKRPMAQTKFGREQRHQNDLSLAFLGPSHWIEILFPSGKQWMESVMTQNP